MQKKHDKAKVKTATRASKYAVSPTGGSPTRGQDQTTRWASDVIVDLMHMYDLPHASLNPGASYRGLHDSIVNYGQNRRLVETVRDWLELTGQERVLDLFCGNGNFSLPLAGEVASVVGLEIFESSIGDAVVNARHNGVTNASLMCVDAADEIKRLATAGEKFDIVLLDPPRAGAADLVGLLPALEPRHILYISCDPPTLARDIATLKKSGYDVVKSLPVDMFPQTYHTESITLLRAGGL